MPTWLITGCSSGFGRELAKQVLARGFNAVVTARNLDTIKDIVAGYDKQALAMPLDVTDHAQVVAAVKAGLERFGAIDVLVNNAGYCVRSAVEEYEPASVKKMFDTNVFGLIEMIQQVLPGMREQGSGTIMNLSSIAGRTSNPGSGFYSATKHAVEGLSNGLRQEVEPLGIRVIVIEPGPFRTDFAGRSMMQSEYEIDAYRKTAGARRKERSNMHGNQIGDPAKAATAMIEAALADNPPHQLLLGNPAIDRMKQELEAQMAELVAWEALGRGTDFE